MKFDGITTALVTPLFQDGTVDYESLKQLLHYQIDNKVHNIVILGGTGEYLALREEERLKTIDLVMEEVNHRVPVIVGILSPGIEDTIKISKYAKKAGAEAIMPITPYYVAPSKEGLINYFVKIDQAVDLPIILYNIPGKTNVNISPETVLELAGRIPNIKGIKECSQDFSQMIELIDLMGDNITVLAGEEHYAVPAMFYGAKGAIIATGNLIPDKWMNIWNYIQKGEYEKARGTAMKYSKLFQELFKEPNPGPLKEAMNFMDLPGGSVKVPLVKSSDNTIDSVIRELQYLGVKSFQRG